MDRLIRIQGEIDELRGRPANVRYRELKRIATALGRILAPKRGRHPTFVNKERNWNPLTIPSHPGALNKLTVRGILDQLEDDLVSLQAEQEGYKYGG
jgi:hypothetical protein